MKSGQILIVMAGLCLCFFGCATVKKGTSAAGGAVGQGADALGGLTEGAVDGYTGTEKPQDNPYGR